MVDDTNYQSNVTSDEEMWLEVLTDTHIRFERIHPI